MHTFQGQYGRSALRALGSQWIQELSHEGLIPASYEGYSVDVFDNDRTVFIPTYVGVTPSLSRIYLITNPHLIYCNIFLSLCPK